MKGANYKLNEGKALIYEDEDLMEYENDNLDSLKLNVQKMNHAVERDDYTNDAYDALFSAELLLSNKSAYDLSNTY